ncbi:hypothetical protein DPEC_G00316960 [Dallia pectoralis]|uniref:Uncharacterized protein n=1 Tax=Dallia pectoralis TaxID=75939 RepID=A0ACC2FD35_DALPE|nr:hypothetical protein DPEC_G00316960 [Dallia pectoralis]
MSLAVLSPGLVNRDRGKIDVRLGVGGGNAPEMEEKGWQAHKNGAHLSFSPKAGLVLGAAGQGARWPKERKPIEALAMVLSRRTELLLGTRSSAASGPSGSTVDVYRTPVDFKTASGWKIHT